MISTSNFYWQVLDIFTNCTGYLVGRTGYIVWVGQLTVYQVATAVKFSQKKIYFGNSLRGYKYFMTTWQLLAVDRPSYWQLLTANTLSAYFWLSLAQLCPCLLLVISYFLLSSSAPISAPTSTKPTGAKADTKFEFYPPHLTILCWSNHTETWQGAIYHDPNKYFKAYEPIGHSLTDSLIDWLTHLLI